MKFGKKGKRGKIVMETLLHIRCDSKVERVAYDADPCPDYGGKVDGWTNDLLYVRGCFVGTSDDVCCPEECKSIGLLLHNSSHKDAFVDELFSGRFPLDVCFEILRWIDETITLEAPPSKKRG